MVPERKKAKSRNQASSAKKSPHVTPTKLYLLHSVYRQISIFRMTLWPMEALTRCHASVHTLRTQLDQQCWSQHGLGWALNIQGKPNAAASKSSVGAHICHVVQIWTPSRLGSLPYASSNELDEDLTGGLVSVRKAAASCILSGTLELMQPAPRSAVSPAAQAERAQTQKW